MRGLYRRAGRRIDDCSPMKQVLGHEASLGRAEATSAEDVVREISRRGCRSSSLQNSAKAGACVAHEELHAAGKASGSKQRKPRPPSPCTTAPAPAAKAAAPEKSAAGFATAFESRVPRTWEPWDWRRPAPKMWLDTSAPPRESSVGIRDCSVDMSETGGERMATSVGVPARKPRRAESAKLVGCGLRGRRSASEKHIRGQDLASECHEQVNGDAPCTSTTGSGYLRPHAHERAHHDSPSACATATFSSSQVYADSNSFEERWTNWTEESFCVPRPLARLGKGPARLISIVVTGIYLS